MRAHGLVPEAMARREGDTLYVPQMVFEIVKRVSRAPERDHHQFCENLEAAAAFVMASLRWRREHYDRAQAELFEQLRAHGLPFVPTAVPEVTLGAAVPPKR